MNIVSFTTKYQDQVVKLIDQVLRDQQVIPENTETINDADLFEILSVYGGRGGFWVAIEKEKVIGTVAIRELDAETAKLNRMFVTTELHGKGVGQSLLEHAIAHAKANGFKQVILNTDPLMKRAHHFYEKNGFMRIGESSDKYHYKKVLFDK